MCPVAFPVVVFPKPDPVPFVGGSGSGGWGDERLPLTASSEALFDRAATTTQSNALAAARACISFQAAPSRSGPPPHVVDKIFADTIDEVGKIDHVHERITGDLVRGEQVVNFIAYWLGLVQGQERTMN